MQVTELEQIVKEHSGLVWKICYRIVGNTADAEDCFQETFVSAMKVMQREKIRSIKAMLGRLATSRCIDRLRQKSRKSEAVRLGDNFDLPANDPGPDRSSENKELAVQLREALSKLSSQEAEAFCLRHVNEFDYGQIASELSLKRSNARVLVHRAKTKLSQLLAGVVLDDNVEVLK